MTASGEEALLRKLRDGDEEAFRRLVEAHHGSLVRLARTFVKTAASAEEMAQETWLAALEGLGRFEGRSSLRTWLFSILANKARTRAAREGRTVLFSELDAGGEDDGPAVEPSRFKANGHWRRPPHAWDERTPERLLRAGEGMALLRAALEDLPPAQRAAVILRDVEGVSAEEACNVLGVSETHQRVLLHRGRSRLRRAMEATVEGARPGAGKAEA